MFDIQDLTQHSTRGQYWYKQVSSGQQCSMKKHRHRWLCHSKGLPLAAAAGKTRQEITGNWGSLVSQVHVWMADHVKLLKQALIQDFRSRGKFCTLSWRGPALSWSLITTQKQWQPQSQASDMTGTTRRRKKKTSAYTKIDPKSFDLQWLKGVYLSFHLMNYYLYCSI